MVVTVTTVASATAPVPRRDVRVFLHESNERQRSLFLQAFAALQARDPMDPKSYAQVSAIHGLPNFEYDNYPMAKPNGGYCVHGQTLFPTWHRPYIALIEMLIIEAAVSIAKTYTTDTQAWVAAAQAIRFPYFDFASYETVTSGIPSILVDETVTVLAAPNAQATSIRNPLASFAMPQAITNALPDNLGALKTYQNTVRFPTSEAPNAKSDVAQLQSAFKQAASNLRSMVRVIFDGTVTKWADFSNHSLDNSHKQPGNYHSLEYVHDQVHGLISGGGGHMGYPEVAAFDPIFYFHHCNVDRLLALYENMFGVYVDDSDARKKLAPFRETEVGGAWDSADAKDVARFGYTYEELAKSGKDLQQSVVASYTGTGAPAPVPQELPASQQQPIKPPVQPAKSQQPSNPQPPTESQQHVASWLTQPQGAPSAPPPHVQAAPHHLNSLQASVENIARQFTGLFHESGNNAFNTAREVVINAETVRPHADHVYAHFSVPKNAINGPFTINFAVNGVPAAQCFIFARVARELCSNCVDYDNLTLGGGASLTAAFTQANLLDRPEAWRAAVRVSVVDWKGNNIRVESLRGLNVFLRGSRDQVGVTGLLGTLMHRTWGEEVVEII
ncbi:hypothetical protein HDU82_004429 [Entophlyctis luteolus]|nr:hypothetical protein HDU82_004429 [Entophlyctis luteolus]